MHPSSNYSQSTSHQGCPHRFAPRWPCKASLWWLPPKQDSPCELGTLNWSESVQRTTERRQINWWSLYDTTNLQQIACRFQHAKLQWMDIIATEWTGKHLSCYQLHLLGCIHDPVLPATFEVPNKFPKEMVTSSFPRSRVGKYAMN